jgi:putative ABC transport system permease protein
MDTVWQDVRYAVRTWRNAPGFVAVVIVTMALGIGANTVVFTVINTVFLHPLPVNNPSELVSVGTSSYPNLRDFRERNQVFTSLAGHTAPVPLTMLRGTTPERVFAEFVTGDYFTTLGLAPVRGRFFARARMLFRVRAPSSFSRTEHGNEGSAATSISSAKRSI